MSFPPLYVIPAKAGIHLIVTVLDSCFHRNDRIKDVIPAKAGIHLTNHIKI